MNKKRTPTVSVIVPNYNYGQFLNKRLQSVIDQTYSDYEIIILDDASSDDSVKIIENWKQNGHVAKVIINSKNSGSAFIQWQRGISMAEGKYIWIAEADDLCMPSFLADAVTMLDKFPRMTLVKSMSLLIDREGKTSSHKEFEEYEADGKGYVYSGSEYIANRMLDYNSFYNASMVVFRKDAYLKIKDKSYSNLKFSGDWLMWGQLMENAEVGEIHKKSNMFRFHGESVTDSRAKNLDLSRAEDEYVKWRLMRLSSNLSRYRRLYNKYKWNKIARKDFYSKVREHIAGLSQDMIADISEIKMNKNVLWMAKHLYSVFSSSENNRLKPFASIILPDT